MPQYGGRPIVQSALIPGKEAKHTLLSLIKVIMVQEITVGPGFSLQAD